MPSQLTPSSEAACEALRAVAQALTTHVEHARRQRDHAEKKLKRYEQVALLVGLCLLVVEYPDVISVGYTAERSSAEEDPDKPYWEPHAAIEMRDERAEGSPPAAEADLTTLLDGAEADVVLSVFGVRPGEPARLTCQALQARAQVLAAGWRDAAEDH